jgi:hypothetical protein
MDHINKMLTTHALNIKKEFLPLVQAACGLARKTLNRYYERTDFSEVYRIRAYSQLHPHYMGQPTLLKSGC